MNFPIFGQGPKTDQPRVLDFLMPCADVIHAGPSRVAGQTARTLLPGAVLEDSSEFLICKKETNKSCP